MNLFSSVRHFRGRAPNLCLFSHQSTPNHMFSIRPFLGQHQRLLNQRGYSSYRKNTKSKANMVIAGIVVTNIGLFVVWNNLLPASVRPQNRAQTLNFLIKNFTVSSQNMSEGRWWTLITHAFSHRDLSHIAFNMITFSSYALLLSQAGIGGGRIALLSLGSAVAGAAGFLFHERAKNPANRQVAIGASGIVMGVGAAAAFIAPKVKFLIFGIIPMPLWVTVPAFMSLDLYLLDKSNSRTAHAGHLGGGIFGGLFAYVFLRRFALWRAR